MGTARFVTTRILRAATAVALLAGALGSGLLAAGPPAAASSVRADGQPKAPAVVVVVDTSGSMNDDDGTGRIKIDGARDAVIEFLRAVPVATPVELRTYPGGAAGSDGCAGGVAVAPLGSSLTSIDAHVRQMTADGGTPTASALQAAADDLHQAGYDHGTVVLVSDGESNCGADPCEVAKSIEQTGLDVTVDTVGFQLDAQTGGRDQMQCIADSTGGVFVEASDSVQLAERLDQLSRPTLDVQATYPQTVDAAVGSDPDGEVTITATVRNVGASPARDAQVTLSFDAGDAPAVVGPRRLLGNLASGDDAVVAWQFRPPLHRDDATLTFHLTAKARGADASRSDYTIRLASGYSLDKAGPILRNAHDVVILGDSYSAGEGTFYYDAGTDTSTNSCHRSPATYLAPLFARSPGRQLHNFACSGAVTADITHPNSSNAGEVAQIDHLKQHRYDAAFMTIGGNDIGFSDLIKECLLVQSCENWPVKHLPPTTLHGLVDDKLDGVEETLFSTYADVEEALNAGRSKPAPLVILAYPMPVPMATDDRYFGCSNAFDGGEQRFFTDLVVRLNAAAKAAADTLHSRGRPVYFVPDTQDAFQPDHTYCSSDPYVNRLSTGLDVLAAMNKTLQVIEDASVAGARPISATFAPSPQAVRRAAAKATADEPAAVSAARAFMGQIHPNADGYDAETMEILRWSTSSAARVPVVRDTSHDLHVTTAHPSGSITVTVDAGSPGQGSVPDLQPAGGVTLQASGLQPGTTTDLVLHSAYRLLGRVTADEHGVATFAATVPAGLPLGAHRLELLGTRADGEAVDLSWPVHVARGRPWWELGLAGAGAAQLAGGVVFWRRSRRYRPVGITS